MFEHIEERQTMREEDVRIRKVMQEELLKNKKGNKKAAAIAHAPLN